MKDSSILDAKLREWTYEIVKRIVGEHQQYSYNGFASEDVRNIGQEIALEVAQRAREQVLKECGCRK
jgi:hydrogenase maturation factor HypE